MAEAATTKMADASKGLVPLSTNIVEASKGLVPSSTRMYEACRVVDPSITTPHKQSLNKIFDSKSQSLKQPHKKTRLTVEETASFKNVSQLDKEWSMSSSSTEGSANRSEDMRRSHGLSQLLCKRRAGLERLAPKVNRPEWLTAPVARPVPTVQPLTRTPSPMDNEIKPSPYTGKSLTACPDKTTTSHKPTSPNLPQENSDNSLHWSSQFVGKTVPIPFYRSTYTHPPMPPSCWLRVAPATCSVPLPPGKWRRRVIRRGNVAISHLPMKGWQQRRSKPLSHPSPGPVLAIRTTEPVENNFKYVQSKYRCLP